MFKLIKNAAIFFIACLSVSILSGYAQSEEIAPFRVTGVDGEVFFRFFADDYRSKLDGVETSRRKGWTAEEGFDLTVHSYFYHPKFIRFDFGGGPVIMQHRFDSDSTDKVKDQNHFLNLHAKANILEDKPFPLVLFYDRHKSTTSYAVEDRMVLRRENYGLNFTLKKPVIPFVVNINHAYSNTDGESALRVTDETTERSSIIANGDLGPRGDGTIGYYRTKTKSESGAKSIDIDSTDRITDFLDIKTEHLLGDTDNLRFTNYFSYKEEENHVDLEELRYRPRLNWTHTKNLKSQYGYSYLHRTQRQIDTTIHAVDLGVGYALPDVRIDMSGDLHADNYETNGFQQNFLSLQYDISHRQPFRIFDIQYSGSWSGDYTDRETTEDQISVLSEHQILSGTTSAALVNTFVVDGSVSVHNKDRTQTFVEDVDYRLITSGDSTSLQRIPTGSILDGEEVLVDYAYQTGGTSEFTSYTQRYRIDFRQGRFFHAFGQYRDINRSLVSGNPTIPLNSQRTKTVGVNVDYPFKKQWMVGGDVEHERHDADIGSFRRNSAGSYVQTPRFPAIGSFRLFADRVLVDNLDSDEDVDLTRFGLRYRSKWNRISLTADSIYEEDTGGTQHWINIRNSIRMDWRYRKLKFTGDARYNSNELGDSERSRASINLTLSRDF